MHFTKYIHINNSVHVSKIDWVERADKGERGTSVSTEALNERDTHECTAPCDRECCHGKFGEAETPSVTSLVRTIVRAHANNDECCKQTCSFVTGSTNKRHTSPLWTLTRHLCTALSDLIYFQEKNYYRHTAQY